MPPQVEVRPVVDALDLARAKWELIINIYRRAGIVRQLLGTVRVEREMLALHAEVEIPLESPLAPVVEPLRLGLRVDEELHLHLLELAHAIGEVAGANLVAKRLADLRDTKGQLPAHALLHVLEVDVDALRRLWPQ